MAVSDDKGGCAAARKQPDRQQGALSAQTGFPAITVPAGFTPAGFPVGIGLRDRPLAETASSP
jgi:Asp-tRNA(Asn)/Glu-tRNA(Gln) amidotransferase A subunit family amidase